MIDHAVIIAGGGPTGLMLGAELTLAGVDAVIIERRVNKERIQPGALGLHARTIEVFDQRGIADRFLAEGKPMQVLGFADVRFDISAFPSRHPYGLALIQRHSERIILNWADELGVPILRDVEITGFTGTRSASTSRSATIGRCGHSISSAATAGAALSVRLRALGSPDRIRPSAIFSPRPS